MRAVLMVTLLLLFLTPSNAFALKCMEMPAVEEAYEKYDGIIIGHAVEVSANKDSNQIKLKVIRSF